MSRQLNLGWIWVALYTIAGTFTLLHVLSFYTLQTHFLFNVGVAGFAGSALVSRFSDGRSLRECLLASIVVALGVTVIGFLPHLKEYLLLSATYMQLLSTVIVIATATLAGSRVGAVWADKVAYEGHTAMGAVMAAIVLVGAFVCHVGLIAIFEQVNHSVAIFLVLLSILVTPAFAGAALQLSQQESVERQLGLGVTLIAAVFLFLIGWDLRSAGIVFLMAIAFLGVGATIYSVSLPGIMTVRASGFWQHRCNQVPLAVVHADGNLAAKPSSPAPSGSPRGLAPDHTQCKGLGVEAPPAGMVPPVG